MTAVWTYPWSLYTEGIETACRDLAGRGIDTLNLASHYHSARTMQPRFPESLFESYPGGCYFDPDESYFEGTPIEPPVNQVHDAEDPLLEITDIATEQGLDVAAWVVCLHNTRLGATHPAYRIESAFGDPCSHALCPSHRAVRDYFAAVVGSLADLDITEIQLETVGYHQVFHDHGAEFGHDKRQMPLSPAETSLLSQCFCDGCHAAAGETGVDLDQAQQLVQEILTDSFNTPHSTPLSLEALVQEHPALQELYEFRSHVIAQFVEGLAEAAQSTPLNYYVFEPGLGSEPGAGWPAGVRLSSLEKHLDRVTALCYVSNPSTARKRIRTLRRSVDLPVDAGVTVDPDVIDTEEDLAAVIDAIHDEGAGKVSIYNHSLMTKTQLDWIEHIA